MPLCIPEEGKNWRWSSVPILLGFWPGSSHLTHRVYLWGDGFGNQGLGNPGNVRRWSKWKQGWSWNPSCLPFSVYALYTVTPAKRLWVCQKGCFLPPCNPAFLKEEELRGKPANPGQADTGRDSISICLVISLLKGVSRMLSGCGLLCWHY